MNRYIAYYLIGKDNKRINKATSIKYLKILVGKFVKQEYSNKLYEYIIEDNAGNIIFRGWVINKKIKWLKNKEIGNA